MKTRITPKNIILFFLFCCISQALSSVNVYVQAPTAPYIFTWYGDEWSEWPGTLMTRKVTVNNVPYYVMSFNSSTINLIFNNGEAQTGQTGDFTGVSGDAFFIYNGGKLAYGEIPDEATANAIGEYVFFVNTDHWNTVNAVINNHTYPMTKIGIDGAGFEVYKWEATSLSYNPSSITFNNGSGKWVENINGEVCSRSYVRGGYYLYAFFLDYAVARLDMPTVIRYIEPTYTVTLNQSDIELVRGSTYKLSVTVSPQNENTPVVEWKSSNPSVATVASNGLVRAISVGQADISASVGNTTATCHVTVTPILAERIEFNSYQVELSPGEVYILVATVYPTNADNRQVTWDIPANSIITASCVDNECRIVANNTGNVDITASTTDGTNLSATCNVQVKISTPVILAESITLDHTTMRIKIGNTEKLTATVLPANTTNKRVSWKSSNTNIAKVNEYGYVTGVKTGTATITASTTDGSNLSKTCRVTIYSNSGDTVLLGDVDDNGVVNIDDVTKLIEYLLADYAAPFNSRNADLDANNKINIEDLTLLISLLLRS